MSKHVSLVAVVVMALAQGCAGDGSPGDGGVSPMAGKADGATPSMPREIHWVRNSAEYHAATRQAYALATLRVEARAAALTAGTWAVSLDADETILDNSQYQKERASLGLGYSPESWTEWVSRKDATAIAGASAFMERVHALGGKVVIVTNRTQAECDDTRANLVAEALVADLVLCKGDTSQKEPRYAAVEAGTASPDLPALAIVMYVGDNIEDFPDLDQTLRFEADEAFAPFGDRFVVIPNPMYGSFEKNAQE